MKVAWTPPAEADVDEMVQHVARDSVSAAVAQERKIYDAASRLGVHPHLGRSGSVTGTRELVVAGTPYVLIYRVGVEAVEVMRVIHGAQLWPPGMGE